MMYAGHLPTMRFSHDEWSNMRDYTEDTFAEDGFNRTRVRGKPVVFYQPALDDQRPCFAVRPIVRVPMGRAVS